MYSWALCTDLHSYLLALSTTNPHGWGEQLFLFSFYNYHHQEDTILNHSQIKKLKKIIPYLLFERFTLKFALFLFMCTTKPLRVDGTTFFFHFLFITIVKRAL